METEEKIATIEAKYQGQLQQKNEKILELERELSEIKAEKELEAITHSRLMESSRKQLEGLRSQINRLNETKINEVASALKKQLGLIRY